MPLPASARPKSASAPVRKYDRRLSEILHYATEVFCEKGYAAASIRDISRASGTSLAGLYYYFKSKDHLLYLIQQEAFSTLISRLHEKLAAASGPEEAIRIFIANHMEHFVGNPKQAQVLSHESYTLRGPYQAEITALKKKYYRQCLTILDNLKMTRQIKGVNSRLAVLSLFGMMNWIYTWYNPAVDGDWKEIAGQMSSIFLNGVLGASAGEVPATRKSARKQRFLSSGNGEAAGSNF